jgi:type III pantothenate kinase
VSLLAIDQGNSRTKCGLVDGDGLTTWAVETNHAVDAADLAALMDAPGVTRVALCTVVPTLIPAWEAAARAAGKPLNLITGTTPTPLRNAYATPETLGPDRLMAAVAAARLAMPVIPVLLGTATVVDAVSDGAYLGGMIAPGVGILAERLSARASALRLPAWAPPEAPIGRSTDEALAQGLFYQAVGGLRAMIAATRAALGVEAPVVLTGGWAPRLAPHLDGVAAHDEHLVLRGIGLIAEAGA